MKELKGAQKKYLRGLAHNLNPSAYIGQKGLTQSLVDEIDQALNAAELVKVKFIEFKEKENKKQFAQELSEKLQCHVAGMIGHVLILYRAHKNKEERQIHFL